MKNKRKIFQYLRHYNALFFSIIFLISCRKDDSGFFRSRNSTHKETNYILNPDFSISDSVSGFPKDWQAKFLYDNLVGAEAAGGVIGWERNSQGHFYIFQEVRLVPGQFYRVSVDCDYNIKNHRPGGVYLMNRELTEVLGKAERFNTEGNETLEFVVNVPDDPVVNLVMGFFDGMNGSIKFKAPRISIYNFVPRIRNSAFSDYLVKGLQLSFSDTKYNSSIRSVTSFVNKVLLSRYNGQPVNTKSFLDMLDPVLYPYFTKNLNELSIIADAYCQRSSLTLGEILTNEFHIPVRQVHARKGVVGFHQFLEYWNPFLKKWIMIDPYFSMVYRKNGELLNTAGVNIDDLPGVMEVFGKHLFSSNLGEAMEIWRAADNMAVDNDYYISYPYGTEVVFVPRRYRTR